MLNYGNRELLRRARILRSSMTIPEIILWSGLRSKKLDGYKFRRQQIILNYIADFYCHELRLIVEVEGEIHSLTENKEYDKTRYNTLTKNGYNIIRLSNAEVESDLNSAINRIRTFIAEICPPRRGTTGGLSNEKQL
ncbi:MAG: endonuclease domain-containing protein [Bacteroidales bacterium]|nr:endonuclease domain-containing protein [Bacteroidales bacterium]